MKIQTTISEERITVLSYYNTEFVSKARALKGKWETPFWVFDTRVEEHVLNAVRSCFGVDGTEDYQTCVLTVCLDEWADKSGVEVLGRPIAKAWGRDSGAKLCEDVICVEGTYTSGGSVKNWGTSCKGTFEVHEFPLEALDRDDVIKAFEDGWASVNNFKIDKVAVQIEIERLELKIKQLKSLAETP